MKHVVLIAILVLGSAGLVQAQTTAPKPAGTAAGPATTAPTPVFAPLPDEKTQTISDAGNGSQTPATAPSTDITVWDFVKMFVILALVIGMILGFLWFMKRLSGQGADGDSPLKVLHTQTLGGSRSLQVVEVGDQVLLVGVSDSGVNLVKELTGTEVADAFRLAASQGRARGVKGFADLLGGFLGTKPKIRPEVGEPVDKSSDFLKKQRERLKKM